MEKEGSAEDSAEKYVDFSKTIVFSELSRRHHAGEQAELVRIEGGDERSDGRIDVEEEFNHGLFSEVYNRDLEQQQSSQAEKPKKKKKRRIRKHKIGQSVDLTLPQLTQYQTLRLREAHFHQTPQQAPNLMIGGRHLTIA